MSPLAPILGVVLLAAPLAPQLTEAGCKLQPSLKPVPSLERLAAERGGLKFAASYDACGGSGSVELSSDGRLSFRCEEGLAVMRVSKCIEPAAARFKGRGATASCDQGGGQTVHLAVQVRAASSSVLRAYAGWSGEPLDADGATWAYVRNQQGLFTKADPSIQIFPGATDRALFEAVKAELQRPPAQGLSCPLLFEAPPAREPREVSEVLFVGKWSERAARELARRLEPVVGPVEVKPWPGEWDHDLVVVAGARRATARPAPDEHRSPAPAR